VASLTPLILRLGGGEWPVSRHGLLTRGEDPPSTVPLVYEARCAPEVTGMLRIQKSCPCQNRTSRRFPAHNIANCTVRGFCRITSKCTIFCMNIMPLRAFFVFYLKQSTINRMTYSDGNSICTIEC